MDKEWKVAISGAGGFVGTFLQDFLERKGCTIISIGRKELANKKSLFQMLYSVDVVINLAGENIGQGFWTNKKKKKIYDSRVLSTRAIVEVLQQEEMGEKVFISASAIGFYGNKVEIEEESENSGEDFLAQVCKDWEKEASAYSKGRTILSRFGVVLSKEGGFLKKMISLASFCLGGRIGNGKQRLSFISIEDLAEILYFCIENKGLKGAVHVVAPTTITNRDFTKKLSSYVKRPLWLFMPTWLVHLLFGEKGEALLLADQKVYPKKLIDAGYHFLHPTIDSHIL